MWILFLHSILSEVMLSVTSLIDMSFFITSTNVIFDLCLPFFYFSFPRLGSTHYFSSYQDVGKNLCRTHKHVNTNTSNHVSVSDNNKLTMCLICVQHMKLTEWGLPRLEPWTFTGNLAQYCASNHQFYRL